MVSTFLQAWLWLVTPTPAKFGTSVTPLFQCRNRSAEVAPRDLRDFLFASCRLQLKSAGLSETKSSSYLYLETLGENTLLFD